jgi:hypothetical protein
MGDTEHHGQHGERFTDADGEIEQMEEAVDSLGTNHAGAGPAAHDMPHGGLPAGADHHTLHHTQPPTFHYRSDAGELTAMEEGVELTEEGEDAARGGGAG